MEEKKEPKKNLYRQQIGRWGEQFAADYLVDSGFVVLGRNIHTPEGEIDLVVRSGKETRFIEVKTRTSKKFGYPEEAVESRKYDHMQAAAEWFLDQNPGLEEDWHLDVIAILGKPGSKDIEINWIKDAEL